MIITRLFVTGYKNLLDCDFSPQKIHAITGCNGAGKSNLLEILTFVARLHSGSDESRQAILLYGASPNESWFPVSNNKERIAPFHCILECILTIDDVQYSMEYALKLDYTNIIDEPYPRGNGAKISSESIKTKEVGATGIASTVLSRNSDADVTVTGGKSRRARTTFKCKSDMTALHALEVREADSFSDTFPILAQFRRALLSTELVRLDPENFRRLVHTTSHSQNEIKPPGTIISYYDPYYLLREIEKDANQWQQFNHWYKQIVDIDGLLLYESKPTGEQSASAEQNIAQYIFLRQHGRITLGGELSMGSTVALAYLTVLYTIMNKGGAALFEEPENYLHPKAVVELIKLFREFSQEHTVIFSTHSPVALNSMKPEEVSVMQPVGDGFVTIQSVSGIKEATDALDRGYLSLGDLLQTDYARK